MNTIVTRNVTYKNYISASDTIRKYLKLSMCPPADIENIYKVSLLEYRYYLDSIGYKMSLPKYPYNPNDKSTWKYLDIKVYGERSKGTIDGRGIKNDKWIYKK
ncbi:MAG TPA: hypothetical protein VNX68_01410 [Nitrosopumilaceae archaeon]|jgi:hypothetical protein|nr:hypothetical protein [Nitrosopumilaceae archaeon]